MRKVLIAAIAGALICTLLTQTFYSWAMLAAMVDISIAESLGIHDTGRISAQIFIIVVNGIIGGTAFAMPVALWQLSKDDECDDK